MNFFGLLTFKAPFLPWVLFGFSLLLGNSVTVDVIGIFLKFCLQSMGSYMYMLESTLKEEKVNTH